MQSSTRKTRFQFESLESRRLLNALVVTSAADSGAGTLRAQVAAAAQSGDTISFAPALAGQTITLTSGRITIAKSLSIHGPGADQLTVSGSSGQAGVIHVLGGANQVEIRGVRIANGSAAGAGGLYNTAVLTVRDCVFADNFANDGGAVQNAGTLTISGSTFSDNTVGGLTDGAGGAILSSAGTLTISNCTFWNNLVFGGSTHVWDDSPNGYNVGYSGWGGALYVSGGTASIDHSTFAGNSAYPGYSDPGYEGSAYGGTICNLAGPGAVRIYNTILADTDVYGSVTSLGHNLIEHAAGGGGGNAFAASDLRNVDPLLGLLQNNGGPTRTMALLAGSPAINAGDNAGAPANDQRGAGFARVVGGTIDIGAFESATGAVADKTWVGPASGGSWSTAANWSPIGVPGAGDAVTISASSVTLSAPARIGGLNLSGGATLTLAGSGDRVLRTSSISISPNSKLNLHDNDLILDYAGSTPMGDVFTKIVAGRGATPSGIFSSQANGSGGLHALGVAEARDVLGLTGSATGTFSGQTVDATTVLVKYTYGGDINFDGKLDADDYGTIDFSVSLPGPVSGYYNGDFNYDGVVNADDYGTIDFNILAQKEQL